ncbi:MoaD/ThiS family protein [Methanosphaerula palustris]|uniref:ThiamineS protein n=1 Tax=Methanosphaerula palustris (strain ATCC BAA-1556 / DSM 19958 / E1-9c) TaxID=521011 RepID=B8GHF1_METPE|nr:MoaD/ThiS family protein [Methanosphaerula palustris]ACL16556.1 thiamineS protein [Methanosphaerula palustris E1-9c]
MITLELPDLTRKLCSPSGDTIEELLVAAGVNPAEVIVVRDGVLLPEDTPLSDGDHLRVISIVHGG